MGNQYNPYILLRFKRHCIVFTKEIFNTQMHLKMHESKLNNKFIDGKNTYLYGLLMAVCGRTIS